MVNSIEQSSVYALDDTGLARLCAAVQKGLSPSSAAALAGISTSTYQRYVKDAELLYYNKPEAKDFSPQYCEFLNKFIEAHEIARADGEEYLVDILRKAAEKDGDVKAAIFLLTNIYPKNWSTRPNRDTHRIKSPQEKDMTELDESELEELASGDEILDYNERQ